MRLLAAVAVVAVSGAAGAEPTSDVRIDWAERRLTALGVGTPRILSPTGSLLDHDAVVLAHDDVLARLRRAFLGLPRPSDEADARLTAAAERIAAMARLDEPRHYADGTVHQAGTLALAALLGDTPPAEGAVAMRLRAPEGFRPCLQIHLVQGGAPPLAAGLPGDPIPHLRWLTGPGPTPLTGEAATSPSRCTLRVESQPAGPPPPALEVLVP